MPRRIPVLACSSLGVMNLDGNRFDSSVMAENEDGAFRFRGLAAFFVGVLTVAVRTSTLVSLAFVISQEIIC